MKKLTGIVIVGSLTVIVVAGVLVDNTESEPVAQGTTTTEAAPAPESTPAPTHTPKPTPEPTSEAPAPESTPTSTYELDGVTFSHVDVHSDFVDDFEVLARVTNTSDSMIDFATFTATIWNEDTIVATATATVSELNKGSTQTVTFISIDDYSSWTDVEFQVDSQF